MLYSVMYGYLRKECPKIASSCRLEFDLRSDILARVVSQISDMD
jgi:hypothetical protein